MGCEERREREEEAMWREHTDPQEIKLKPLHHLLQRKLGVFEDKKCDASLKWTQVWCDENGMSLVQGNPYPVIDGVEFKAGCDCEVMLNWPWYDDAGVLIKVDHDRPDAKQYPDLTDWGEEFGFPGTQEEVDPTKGVET